MERVGAYYYVFPTYNQGKKILWTGADKSGFRFLDHIPESIRKRTVGNEMFIELINGSTIQVVGSDNIDSIVGTNPLGVVFSEYSLQDPKAWDYIRPILAENGGWAIFNFTPRGKNHAYYLLKFAEQDQSWFVSNVDVSVSKAISEAVLEQERRETIAKNGDDSLFLQEYYNSFEAAIRGSYYGKIIEKMRQDGRVGKVPYDENLPVHTWWDLGMNDSMTIGFFQVHGKEWRMIDYYENSGEGLRHYYNVLKDKGYTYGKHYAPHDIVVRELSSGKSRLEAARELGLHFETIFENEKEKSAVPNLPIDDGIDAVRRKLSTLWIDEGKCQRFIEAVTQYRKDFNEKLGVYRSSPVHDWTSHPADMLRYWAVTPEYSDEEEEIYIHPFEPEEY